MQRRIRRALLGGLTLSSLALGGLTLVGLTLVGLALAGCAGDASGTPTAGAPTVQAGGPSASTSAAPVETPTPAGPTDGVLIEFERRGGIAGVVDRLEIHRDGGFTLSRAKPSMNRTGRLTAAELSDLNRKIDASGFAGLPADESASGSDLFLYHLTYGGRQIQAQDGGVAAPLQPVVSALSAMVQRYGS